MHDQTDCQQLAALPVWIRQAVPPSPLAAVVVVEEDVLDAGAGSISISPPISRYVFNWFSQQNIVWLWLPAQLLLLITSIFFFSI